MGSSGAGFTGGGGGGGGGGTTNFSEGTLAARPTAAAFGVGTYFAVNDHGGTYYGSDGASWTMLSRGLSEGVLLPAGTAKGDLLVATAPGVIDRLAIGADGMTLLADSTSATGMKWYGRSRSLADIHTDASVVNSTVETTLFTFPVPATFAIGDIARFSAGGDMLNNSGSNVTYTFRFKLGTTTIVTSNSIGITAAAGRRAWYLDGFLLVVAPTGAPDERLTANLLIASANAATWAISNQGAGNGYGGSFTGAAAEDISAAPSLSLTVQLGTAAPLADFYLHTASFEAIKR